MQLFVKPFRMENMSVAQIFPSPWSGLWMVEGITLLGGFHIAFALPFIRDWAFKFIAFHLLPRRCRYVKLQVLLDKWNSLLVFYWTKGQIKCSMSDIWGTYSLISINYETVVLVKCSYDTSWAERAYSALYILSSDWQKRPSRSDEISIN